MSDSYLPRRTATSRKLLIRGVEYHVLQWGRDDGPPLLLLHGWMDCAASFQFLVDMAPDALMAYRLLAVDWRGFGRSAWTEGGYWFADYLADLDELIDALSPDCAVSLVGHSMGGMAAGLYAGIRPERVRHLVSLEGFGLPATQPEQAPARYARWFEEARAPASFRQLADLAEVSERLCKANPRLNKSWADWLAPEMAEATADGWRYRADPRHKWVNPVLYRLEEAMVCWRNIRAPVLWMAGEEQQILRWLRETPEQFEQRKACFARFHYASLPDCGHNLHHDAPAEVGRRLVEFLAAYPD